MKKCTLLIFLFTSFFSTCFAQQFGDTLNLPSISYGSVAWGDFDNDGDLDILMTGRNDSLNPMSKILRNDDNDIFTDINAGLIAVKASNAVWGDYDNDGDLDILLAGETGVNTRTTKIYRNDGGSFIDINAGLLSTDYGSVAWGDFDNDGDLDVIITGRSIYGHTTRLYRNENGSFINTNANLTQVAFGSAILFDYDNDNDSDILLTGVVSYNPTVVAADVYRNQNGNFVNDSTNLPNVHHGDVAIADWENDGYLDVLLTGTHHEGTTGGFISEIYYNTGSGFNLLAVNLIGVVSSSVAWGDFDNDGDSDILLTGTDGNNTRYSNIYRNDGDGGGFVPINTGFYNGVDQSSVAWGDYDNDGDLDVLLTGIVSYAPNYKQISTLYKNIGNSNNWINIKCVGTMSNTSAIGAKVKVKTNKWQMKEIEGWGNGQNSLNAEFGLGAASIIDTVKIEWPSGIVTKLSNVNVNQFLVVSEDTLTGIDPYNKDIINSNFILYQNYPNPFNQETTINYYMHKSGKAVVNIFTIDGRLIKSFSKYHTSAGYFEIKWDGRNYINEIVGSGVYLCQFVAGNNIIVKKMIMLK